MVATVIDAAKDRTLGAKTTFGFLFLLLTSCALVIGYEQKVKEIEGWFSNLKILGVGITPGMILALVFMVFVTYLLYKTIPQQDKNKSDVIHSLTSPGQPCPLEISGYRSQKEDRIGLFVKNPRQQQDATHLSFAFSCLEHNGKERPPLLEIDRAHNLFEEFDRIENHTIPRKQDGVVYLARAYPNNLVFEINTEPNEDFRLSYPDRFNDGNPDQAMLAHLRFTIRVNGSIDGESFAESICEVEAEFKNRGGKVNHSAKITSLRQYDPRENR